MPTNLYGPGDNYHSKIVVFCLRLFGASMRPSRIALKASLAGAVETLCVNSFVDLGGISVRFRALEPHAVSRSFERGHGVDLSIRELADAVAVLRFLSTIHWDTAGQMEPQEAFGCESNCRSWLAGTDSSVCWA